LPAQPRDTGRFRTSPGVYLPSLFNDANGDGAQDNGQTGIENVEVYLDLGNVGYFVNGDPTTMTNTAGGYTLSSLAAGTTLSARTRRAVTSRRRRPTATAAT
jgi:hypothetical protein